MRGMMLKELMEDEIFKEAKTVKYMDIDHKPLDVEKFMVNVNVLFRELQEDGTLVIMLWVENKMPDGWKVLSGATTAPKGFEWITNGKSMLSTDYRCALLRQ